MDFTLLSIGTTLATKVAPIAIAILFFGFIILIHEFGHFIFAKLFKVKVNEFAIGMGPTILKKQGKETKYALRLFPIGGFVAMEGEGEESDDTRAYCNQKIWKRMIIISAGAIFNLILGFIVCIFLVSGDELVGTNEILGFEGEHISSQKLQPGDEILEIDGKRVFSDYDISFLMQRNGSGYYDFVVERDGERVELDAVPFAKQTRGNFGYTSDCVISSVSANLKRAGLKDGDIITSLNGTAVANGDELMQLLKADEDFIYDLTVKRGDEELSFDDLEFMTVTVIDFIILGEEKNAFNVTETAFRYSLSMGRMVYLSLFDLIRGQYGINELAGPIGTVSVITDIAEASVTSADWTKLFMIMAMITINIGLFNLLPVPALDGGHLFFMFIELIVRKPIPQKYVSWIHAAGLVILLLFMAIISFSDLYKWISGIGFY